ncbi:unnamed protein product, partial [Rotaria sp. Silwood1]
MTNPLESLVERTNNFLLGLWVNKHISQKAHEQGTPLRPIMSSLKSPTIAISKWLDGLLRPLFNRLGSDITIANGAQLIKQVEKWSAKYLTPATSFITMDVTDLYTMIPQEGRITAIRRLIETSVVTIPNLGCQDTDWTNGVVVNSVALVKRGLLIYNDGTSPDGFNPMQGLVNGVDNASVIVGINVSDANGIGNICADTQTGDKTKTVVVGAHSDGVPAGSGINDNGSGTVGILVLALNIARLFQTSSLQYSTYQYRIRFCWWGAEELGLIGARYHVEQALLPSTNIVGERLQDYLVNLNYDMLAGPNYR